MALAQDEDVVEEEVEDGEDDDATSPPPAPPGNQGGGEETKDPGKKKKKGGMLLAILKKIRSFLDIKKGEKVDAKNVSKALARHVGSLYGIGGLLVGSVGGYLLGSVAACVSFLGSACAGFIWMLEYTWEKIVVEFGEVTASAKGGAAGGVHFWIPFVGLRVIFYYWWHDLRKAWNPDYDVTTRPLVFHGRLERGWCYAARIPLPPETWLHPDF